MSDSDQDAIVVVDSDNNEARKSMLVDLVIGDGDYAERRSQFPKRAKVSFVNLSDNDDDDDDNDDVEALLRQMSVARIGDDVHVELRFVHYKTLDDVLLLKSNSPSSPAQTASSGMDVENHATTVAFKWGCWCADDGAHVPFPDSGNDFSAHPPRVVRSVLMKHLSLGHDLILYK